MGLIKKYVGVVASQADEAAEELTEAATEKARLDVVGAKRIAQQVESDLEKMSRERLSPDEKTLKKVARYEAYLSRKLYKAMHELPRRGLPGNRGF